MGERQRNCMIYDKIKIYVTQRILDIINKDAESFEFFKKDGVSLNKNAFLTKLIVNYSNDFRQIQNADFDFVKKSLRQICSIESKIEELSFKLSERINKRVSAFENEKFDKLISIKPTKESCATISYIENYDLKGISLSEYFRNMLAYYSSMPQDKRESIIFKTQKDAILQAIKNHKKIYLSTKTSTMVVSPYATTHTKEELHGYLLAVKDKKCFPIRLSRIESVDILQENAFFYPDQISLFEKMLTFGPQFAYGKDEGQAVVKLTETGKQWFKKIYLHRPLPVKVEEDLYYFDCSHSQVLNYFKKFGANAQILEPIKLKENMSNFYKSAYRLYKHKKSTD